MSAPSPLASTRNADLAEVAKLFLKLGLIAFGGPAAHIAMMREEVVRRRKWVTEQQFLDLLGASNLIPGPTSTELAIYLGYTRAGPPGLLIAGGLFILLGLSPKLSAILSIMPPPVAGAIVVFVVCFMMTSGLQIMLSTKATITGKLKTRSRRPRS